MASRREAPPPPGAPWDLPLAEAPLAFLDLEMTGLDVAQDHVVEICLERWRGDHLEGRLVSLVAPPARLGGAAHVHGLDASALAGAPAFAELAPRVLELVDGAVLVAHAAQWDVDFLVAELARSGHPWTPPPSLDTLILSRRAFALPRHALGALATHFGIAQENAHRAEDDVRVLRAIFARCVEALAPVSVRDLWEVRVGQRRARAVVVDACEAAAKHGAPVPILYRPSKRPPVTLTFVVQSVEAAHDPPRVVGYELPGHSRRELRADRILRVGPEGSPEGGDP